MGINMETGGKYVKTDATGRDVFRYVYNAGGDTISSGCVVAAATSAASTEHTLADGTTFKVYHLDHVYLDGNRTGVRIGGVGVQRIPAGECGWVQTKGYHPSVNLSSQNETMTWPAGTTLGAGGSKMYGGPRGVGLGRLAQSWAVTAAGTTATGVFIDIDTQDHVHGVISAGHWGAVHAISGTLGITGDMSVTKLIASETVSAHSTADLYVGDDSYLSDDVHVGGKLNMSSTAIADALWCSAGIWGTRGISTRDAFVAQAGVTVLNSLSALNTISCDGLSADTWLNVDSGVVTADKFGLSSSQYLQSTGTATVASLSATGNITASTISAVNTISCDGLSADTWLSIDSGVVTADKFGLSSTQYLQSTGTATVASLSATGNITASTISAVNTISCDGLSADTWLNIDSGVVTANKHGLSSSGYLVGKSMTLTGDPGAGTASQVKFTADTKAAGNELMYLVGGPAVTNDWDVVDGGPAGSMIWMGVYIGTLKYIIPAFCCSA